MAENYKPTQKQQTQFIWKDPLPCIIEFGHSLFRIGLNQVVDLGCRVGGNSIALSKIGLNVTAVDAYIENLDIVQGRAHVEKCNINTIHNDLTVLPFQNETIHALITSTAIHHSLPNQAKDIVDEILRILKPGGRVLVAVLSIEDYRYGTGDEVATNTFENTSGPEIKSLHQFFSKESLLSLFGSFVPECKPFIVPSTYIMETKTGKKQGRLLVGKFMKGINTDVCLSTNQKPLALIKKAKRSIELLITYPILNCNELGSACIDFLEALEPDFLKNVYCQCVVAGNCSINTLPLLKKLQRLEGNNSFSLAYSEQTNETQTLDIAIIDGITVYSSTHSESASEPSILSTSNPEIVSFFRQHLTGFWKKSTVIIDNGKKYQSNRISNYPPNENEKNQLGLNVTVIDCKNRMKEHIRIGVTQLKMNDILYPNEKQLLKPDLMELPNTIEHILLKAENLNLNLLLLPELSGDKSINEKLQGFATNNNIVIVGGSYYDSRRVNCCPVAIPGSSHPYIIEKVHPSPFEHSPKKDSGVKAGSEIYVFKNTVAGSFGVVICSDFLNDAMVEDICSNNIDFLCVISMNNDSPRFFEKMNSRCQNSQEGIYILYSNSLFYSNDINTDGSSSIFGFMDRLYLNKLDRKKSDYPYKIASLSVKDEGILVADINIHEKRPVYRNPESKPNISDIESVLFT